MLNIGQTLEEILRDNNEVLNELTSDSKNEDNQENNTNNNNIDNTDSSDKSTKTPVTYKTVTDKNGNEKQIEVEGVEVNGKIYYADKIDLTGIETFRNAGKITQEQADELWNARVRYVKKLQENDVKLSIQELKDVNTADIEGFKGTTRVKWYGCYKH